MMARSDVSLSKVQLKRFYQLVYKEIPCFR